MTGNKSKKHMSNTISDFLVLKYFNIQTREGMAVSFIELIWQVPFTNWCKVNIDGATKDCFGLASCASIVRGSHVEYVSSFKSFLGVQTSIYPELVGVIYVLEYA